jgi:hypothetical protein
VSMVHGSIHAKESVSTNIFAHGSTRAYKMRASMSRFLSTLTYAVCIMKLQHVQKIVLHAPKSMIAGDTCAKQTQPGMCAPKQIL